jgi:hypothetical protein
MNTRKLFYYVARLTEKESVNCEPFALNLIQYRGLGLEIFAYKVGKHGFSGHINGVNSASNRIEVGV